MLDIILFSSLLYPFLAAEPMTRFNFPLIIGDFSHVNDSYCSSLRTTCGADDTVCALDWENLSLNLQGTNLSEALDGCQHECLIRKQCKGFQVLWPNRKCHIFFRTPTKFIESKCCLYYHSNMTDSCEEKNGTNLVKKLEISYSNNQYAQIEKLKDGNATTCVQITPDKYGQLWVVFILQRLLRVKYVAIVSGVSSIFTVGLTRKFSSLMGVQKRTYPLCSLAGSANLSIGVEGKQRSTFDCDSIGTLSSYYVIVLKGSADNVTDNLCEVEIDADIPCNAIAYDYVALTYPDKKVPICPFYNYYTEYPVQLNLALGRQVYLSSENFSNSACMLVDGDANPVRSYTSAVGAVTRNWIQVDLGVIYEILFVVLANSPKSNQLSGAKLGTSLYRIEGAALATTYDKFCGVFDLPPVDLGLRTTIECASDRRRSNAGRFVLIAQNNFTAAALVLAEIEVYGEPVQPSCPLNFTIVNDTYCYQLITDETNWINAVVKCSELDNLAHLVVMENATEEAAVQYFLETKPNDCSPYFYTAGIIKSESFVWKPAPNTFDEPINRQLTFNSGSSGSSGDCLVTTKSDNRWNKGSCFSLGCYICEIDLKTTFIN